MNTQKVVNEYGNKKQRVDFAFRYCFVVLFAYLFNRTGSLICSKRLEQYKRITIAICCAYIILNVFEPPAYGLFGMTVYPDSAI